MPRVTKEIMQTLRDGGAFPPRHQLGCQRNFIRMLPLIYAAKGKGLDEIKSIIKQSEPDFPCTCEK